MVNIGKSVVIKGELSGSEDLTIEGHVEGRIDLKDNVLTIGPNGKIKAEVFAKSVVVLGEVTGNVTASEKVDIRDNGSVDGDIASPRVAIAEGAHFRGSVDMQRAGQKAQRSSRPSRASRSRSQASSRASRNSSRARRSARNSEPMADATRSLTDLFGMFGHASGRRRGRRCPIRLSRTWLRPSYPDQGAAQVPHQPAGQRRTAAGRSRSRRRQQRHVLRRATRLPAARRRRRQGHRSARQGRHDSISCPEFFAKRFTEAPGTVDGILCWDVLDYLDRPAAQALATALSSLLRPDGCLLGFFSTADSARAALHEVRRRR